jgi:hypothetical protein
VYQFASKYDRIGTENSIQYSSFKAIFDEDYLPEPESPCGIFTCLTK